MKRFLTLLVALSLLLAGCGAQAVASEDEIAHAIAQHGAERMSQGLMQQLGGVALSVAIQNEPQTTQNIFRTAYGLGSTVGVILPFSRTQESEADRIGLIAMAMAGYNPNAALDLDKNVAK